MTVVEEGRHSVGLLPIPADRERQQPLPEDTVEVELLVVDGDGEIDPQMLDVRWFWCIRDLPCTRGQQWLERSPCPEDRIPSEPCLMGSQPRLRYAIPPFDPEWPLFTQYRPTWLTVAGVPFERDTESCLRSMADSAPTDLDGCLIGIQFFDFGPMGPFLAAAQRDGVEFDEYLAFDQDSAFDPRAASQPGFNPELTELVFTDFAGSTLAVARSGEPTQVPAGVELYPGPADRRDSQVYVTALLSNGGSFLDAFVGAESLGRELYTTESGRMGGRFGSSIMSGAAGDAFSILMVIRDGRGGQSWEWLDFEVVP